MGLRLRLTLSLVVPLILIVGVHGLVRVRDERQTLESAHRQALARSTALMAAALESALARPGSDLRPLIHQLARSQQSTYRVRLFDGHGTLIASPPGPPLAVDVPPSPVVDVLRDGAPRTATAGRSRSTALLRVEPVRAPDGSVAGAVEVIEPATGIETQVDAAIRDVWLRLGLVTLAVAAATELVLQRQVFDRLAALMHGIVSLGEGRRGARVMVDRRDELGRVAEAFNNMAAQLETAQRKLESETQRALDLQHHLRHAERLTLVGKLASGLAHEIGTPLNIISGRAELLLESLPPGDARRRELGSIVEQIDRITTFIRSVLDTARRGRPIVEPLGLHDVVDRIWPLMEHAARRRGITLASSIAPDLPHVVGDASQLQQVLVNLLMNAFEATPAGGRVALTAASGARHGRAGIAVTVRDTGGGIRPEDEPRIFDAFFSTKPPGQGTGLGLAISRDIVRDHGGTIAVSSTGPDGTAVTVWLPVADEAQRAA
jgi:two-component system, NtrC family, sensor kinase